MKQNSSNPLPIKGNYAIYLKMTWMIAAAMLISAISSLIFKSAIYPTDELIRSFLANDIVNILIGIPVMIIPIRLVKSNKLIGLLVWLGALLFALYNYLIYLLSLPFSFAYILYLLIILLSGIVLYQLLKNMDSKVIKSSISKAISNRWISGLLIMFGLMFLSRAAMQIGNHLLGQAHLPITEIALNSADIVFSLVWISCGIALLRRKPLGYVTSLGLLYQLSMLFIGLILVLIIQPIIMNEPLPIVDLIVLATMSLIVIVPFFIFVKALRSK